MNFRPYQSINNETKTLLGYDVNGDGKVSVLEFKRIMLRSGKREGMRGPVL